MYQNPISDDRQQEIIEKAKKSFFYARLYPFLAFLVFLPLFLRTPPMPLRILLMALLIFTLHCVYAKLAVCPQCKKPIYGVGKGMRYCPGCSVRLKNYDEE